jgi:hypothetical protein
MRAAIASAVVMLALPAGALGADGSWSAPVTLSGDAAGSPRVALTPGGEAIAAWGTELDADSPVQVTTRAPGDRFAAPQTLSAGAGALASLSANAAGAAVAIWRENLPVSPTKHAAVRPAGGAFQPVTDGPWAGSGAVLDDVAAVAPNGDVFFVMWQGEQLAVVRRGAGGFGEPRAVGAAATVVHASVDSAGRLTLVFLQRVAPGGAQFRPVSVTGTPEDGFTDPEAVPGDIGGMAGPIAGAANARGDIALVWAVNGGTFPGFPTGIKFALKPAGAGWSPAEDVPGDEAPSGQHDETDAAIDADGNAIVVWSDAVSAFSAYRRADGRWGEMEAVTRRPVCCDAEPSEEMQRAPHAGFDASGNAILLWASDSTRPGVLRAARRPPGGPWDPFETVIEPGAAVFDSDVAVDDAGRAVAIWTTKEHTDRRDSGANRVQVSIFDPLAPAVTAFRRRPGAFAYRASRPARATVRLQRLGKRGKARRVGSARTAGYARSGRVRLGRRLARRVSRPGRYRATLVATGRNGRTAAPRRLVFRKRPRGR